MALKIAAGRGDFTSFGGLPLVEACTRHCQMRKLVIDHMPHQERAWMRNRDYSRFLSLTYGFVVGADCIHDIEVLYQDPGFRTATQSDGWCASSVGNFLNAFLPYQVRRLNEALKDHALRLRRMATKDPKLVIDIDSTLHRQYAKKMEGLSYAYDKKTWGLSSLMAFDQYGFQYWMDVKPGNTFTADGAGAAIRHIFRHVPRRMQRFLRADSGYCNAEVTKACSDLNVKFVIAMRENMYDPIISRVKNWRRPKGDVRFRDGREAEIGSTHYHMKNAGRLFKVVFLRARKPQGELFHDKGYYDYVAFVTNIDEHEMRAEKLLEFYRKRGNAENFIKEAKNGYDLHHLPCRRLLANKAYGVIAAYAHNLMRALAHILDKKQVPYHKRIRFRMIYLAGQVVRKARSVIIRLNPFHHKEVNLWLTTTNIAAGTG